MVDYPFKTELDGINEMEWDWIRKKWDRMSLNKTKWEENRLNVVEQVRLRLGRINENEYDQMWYKTQGAGMRLNAAELDLNRIRRWNETKLLN